MRNLLRVRSAASAVWLLAPIIAVAAFLRFDGLSSRGILYWDEGKFALEGVRLMSVLQSMLSLEAGSLAGKAIGTAKPTHALLIAATYALFGIHDYASLYLHAAASVGAVAFTYMLGARLFNRAIGLMGAAFLAVSPYDIIYARSILSESDAGVLFLLGVLVWWIGHTAPLSNSRRGWIAPVVSGLLLGAAFTTNYRLLVYIAALGLVVFVVTLKVRGRRGTAVTLMLGACAFLVFPLLWEGAGLVAQRHGIVLFRSEITYRPTSYLAEVLYQLHGGKQSALHFDPGMYVRWFLARQGWPFSLLLVAGLVIAAVRRTVPHLALATLVVVPYAVYAFAPFIVPRNLDASLPFAALLAASGLAKPARLLTVRRSLPLALTAGTLVVSGITVGSALPLLHVRSGFARATTYLDRHRTIGALVDDEVMRFYLRDPGQGCDGQKVPWRVGDLRVYVRAGNDFAVLTHASTPTASFLRRQARHVARFSALGAGYRGENLIESENGYPPSSTSSDWVIVYSLRDLDVPRSHLLHPATCSLDRLA